MTGEMGSFRDDESIHSMQSIQSDSQWSSASDEKIFVAVRLRPLNDKETARNDRSEWECINSNTIMHKHGMPEKSLFPTAYTFDRVFASHCSTKEVYEEGPKKIALSVVSGINTSIFAYGQTSSGKTYTMHGITEYTMADIFDYIDEHDDREFVLKFSAMEIYNESVRDLLGLDSTPLRLLDDPERGTVVDRLTEVTLRDWSHLKELLAVCEAERQIGETSLNEVSSRSHQIIRLTVESSACEFSGAENQSTLAATVSFVDLAGSERASQTSAVGTRLKEGSHINRSLLTLGTVIRKLSKGRHGHIPFRDSKLTRILQNSLGGNARTAIICTMSPAHSHVEQSRNTLLFAVCAKKVSTNAQVNLVMSEKALVKQLQRELARLENELRSLSSISAADNSASLLREKERLIEKMDTEIRELTQQRDLAQSRIQEMLQSKSNNQVSQTWVEADHLSGTREKRRSWDYENSVSDQSEVSDPPRLDGASNNPYFAGRSHGHGIVNRVQQLRDKSEELFLSDGSPSEFMNKYFGPDLSRGWEELAQKNYESSEDSCKEVRCIEVENNKDENIEKSAVSSPHKGDRDLGHVQSGHTCDAPELESQDMQTTSDDGYIVSKPSESSSSSSDTNTSSSERITLVKTRSCGDLDTAMSLLPLSEKAEKNAIPLTERELGLAVKQEAMLDADSGIVSTKDSTNENDCVDEPGQSIKTRRDDGTNEVKYGENMVHDSETNKELIEGINGSQKVHSPQTSSSDWKVEFQRQRKEIIKLWDTCFIPLVHRTYFFLLFQGDPSDSVYMEVEFRRLSFLMQTASRGTSSRALNRERDMLSKQMLRKFSAKERDDLYKKWDIDLNSKKRRKQLSQRLWKDTENMDHIEESAALVAKLIGEPGKAPKETFELSFAPQHRRKSSCGLY